MASQVNGVWYNHHYDAQGNCILLSNASGEIEQQYDYDAFGFPYFYTATGYKSGNPKTRFLFTGREWIVDMRVYDYRARLYQPELGRFLQPDPQEFAASDYNLYRYCHNDPVNSSDPTGLREELAGEIMRDIIWDMARYADSANTSQGSFADFTRGAYMGADGGGKSPSAKEEGANGQFRSQRSGGRPSGHFDKRRFYRPRNLRRFDKAIAHVFGRSAIYVPAQTLENAPEVDTTLNARQLYARGLAYGARHLSSGKAAGLTSRTPTGIRSLWPMTRNWILNVYMRTNYRTS